MKLAFQTIRYDQVRHRLTVLDQSSLPARERYLTISTIPALCRALKTLTIRGAPLIGVCAAYGVAMARAKGGASHARQAIHSLMATRPTAVNLAWALKRMRKVLDLYPGSVTRLVREARAIETEDQASCLRIGRYGQHLITSGMKIMVHCNAGALATSGLGTALAVIYTAHTRRKQFEVYVRETRPLLQGSRLTAWELTRQGVSTICICDSMAAYYMPQMDLVLVGADRIARNGDTANKIGTQGLAIIARHYGVPFYACAPHSTFDPALPHGAHIPIEIRADREVRSFNRRTVIPGNARVLNPAFDVTPASLITGIVTDHGILRPPYRRAITGLFDRTHDHK